MARRGRPRHPDILTPREWEVLALLRDGLTNEQIAARLDFSIRTARFHVSEILSKLGVSTRQEAAHWQPDERARRWPFAFAPLALLRGYAWAATAIVIAAAATGGSLLVWGMTRTDGGTSADNALSTQQIAVTSRPEGELLSGPGVEIFTNTIPGPDAEQQLLDEPGVGPVVQAALAGDADAFLELVDWEPSPCRTRDVDVCPPGETQLPALQFGYEIYFPAFEHIVVPGVRELLAEPMRLAFASHGPVELVNTFGAADVREGYFVGLTGAPRTVSQSALWGDAGTRDGIFLVVDPAAERPVQVIGSLGETWGAATQAFELAFANHEVLTMQISEPVAFLVCADAMYGSAILWLDDRFETVGLFCGETDEIDGTVMPAFDEWRAELLVETASGVAVCNDSGPQANVYRGCANAGGLITLNVLLPP